MKWSITEDLGFAILLGPTLKEEDKFVLRTRISPHSRSHFRSEKERANDRSRSRMRMKYKKKALTKLPGLFLFVEKRGHKSNRK